MEQRREVQVRRQPQRREAEAADAQPARTPWRRCRRRACTAPAAPPGPRPAAPPPSRRPARRRRWSPAPGRWWIHSMPTSGPDHSRSCRGTLLLAGQGAAVDGRAGPAGDDVVLVAGVQPGRVGGVAQRRADHVGDRGRAWRSTAPGRSGSSSRSTPSTSDSASRNVPHGLGQHQREPVPPDPGHRLGQRGHRVVVVHASSRGPAGPGRAAAASRCPSRPSRSGRAAGRRATVYEKPPTSPIASVQPSNSSGWLSTSQCAP